MRNRGEKTKQKQVEAKATVEQQQLPIIAGIAAASRHCWSGSISVGLVALAEVSGGQGVTAM